MTFRDKVELSKKIVSAHRWYHRQIHRHTEWMHKFVPELSDLDRYEINSEVSKAKRFLAELEQRSYGKDYL